MELISTTDLVPDTRGVLPSRRRILVSFLLDLADYLAVTAHPAEAGPAPGRVPLRWSITGSGAPARRRDGVLLFRRALAMANGPCLESLRTGLERRLGDARTVGDTARAETFSDLLGEVELRLSLFRDMRVGMPPD